MKAKFFLLRRRAILEDNKLALDVCALVETLLRGVELYVKSGNDNHLSAMLKSPDQNDERSSAWRSTKER